MYRLKIADNSRISKVQQIVQSVVQDIASGKLKKEEKLPSINQFSDENNVGRDTVEKAYRQLKRSGHIASFPGRGYFVVGRNIKEVKVLLVFNRLSSFKKIIYDALLEGLGKKAKVDLQIHHYDPKRLKEILEVSLGKYNYYVIMPHFFSKAHPEEYLNIIRMVPSNELILLDKSLPQFHSNCKAVYQDFQSDIYEALLSSGSLLKKYKSLTLIFPEDIHHPKEFIEGIEAFCDHAKMEFFLMGSVGAEGLREGTVYLVTEEDDLARLIKKVRQSELVLGKDIGIISFNETVFKELLDITVISTNFQQMGLTASQLILNRECLQYKNPYQVIHRGSL